MAILAANRRTPNILFMVNNAAGPDAFLGAVDRERILLGFAGAGGTREAGIVRYRILSSQQQATTLGELDGSMISLEILSLSSNSIERRLPQCLPKSPSSRVARPASAKLLH